MQQVIPVKIRPHLVQFFYNEFKGKEARYLNKQVKACNISMTSSIGKLFRITLEKSGYPVKKIESFNLFISISETCSEKNIAKIYKVESGRNSFLKVPEKVADLLNDVLEDQFRIVFVSTVKGAMKYSENITIKEVISDFMTEYSLDDFGYQLETLRTLYNRTVKKKHLLSRLQSKNSNLVLNYSY
jgi:hypothetical protein